MLTHQILRRRIKLEFKKLHMLLTYRKFNKRKFISRLFKMLKSRNFNIRLRSSSFLWYGDSTGGSAHCQTDKIFKITWQNCIACKVKISFFCIAGTKKYIWKKRAKNTRICSPLSFQKSVPCVELLSRIHGAKQSWIFQIRRKALDWHLYLPLINADCTGSSVSWLSLDSSNLTKSLKANEAKTSQEKPEVESERNCFRTFQPRPHPFFLGKSPGDEVVEPENVDFL